jgi:hypothetical protein
LHVRGPGFLLRRVQEDARTRRVGRPWKHVGGSRQRWSGGRKACCRTQASLCTGMTGWSTTLGVGMTTSLAISSVHRRALASLRKSEAAAEGCGGGRSAGVRTVNMPFCSSCQCTSAGTPNRNRNSGAMGGNVNAMMMSLETGRHGQEAAAFAMRAGRCPPRVAPVATGRGGPTPCRGATCSGAWTTHRCAFGSTPAAFT